jgi:hypothetical protein
MKGGMEAAPKAAPKASPCRGSFKLGPLLPLIRDDETIQPMINASDDINRKIYDNYRTLCTQLIPDARGGQPCKICMVLYWEHRQTKEESLKNECAWAVLDFPVIQNLLEQATEQSERRVIRETMEKRGRSRGTSVDSAHPHDKSSDWRDEVCEMYGHILQENYTVSQGNISARTLRTTILSIFSDLNSGKGERVKVAGKGEEVPRGPAGPSGITGTDQSILQAALDKCNLRELQRALPSLELQRALRRGQGSESSDYTLSPEFLKIVYDKGGNELSPPLRYKLGIGPRVPEPSPEPSPEQVDNPSFLKKIIMKCVSTPPEGIPPERIPPERIPPKRTEAQNTQLALRLAGLLHEHYQIS